MLQGGAVHAGSRFRRQAPRYRPLPAAHVNVEIGFQAHGLRQRKNRLHHIDLDNDITYQLNHWLSETAHV